MSDELLSQLADEAEAERNGAPNVRKPRKPKLYPFQSFPTEALPEVLQRFVEAASGSVSCDPSFIALPALATLASAIGNSVRFGVTPDYSEPCLLWCAIVGPPGDRKTPAIGLATAPLLEIQRELQEQYAQDKQEHDQKWQLYSNALAKWKKAPQGIPPMAVEALARPRAWCDDTTTEALGMVLRDNPRGCLLRKDELTSWLRSFSEYKAHSGDAQRWLSIHNAVDVTIDRKSLDEPIFLRAPNVSVVGGLQPPLLKSFFRGEHIDSGLLQRFLFSWPPRMPAKATRVGIACDIKADYNALVRRLQQLPFNGTSATLPLSQGAWEVYEQWHTFVEQEFKPSVGDILHGVGAKLTAASIRLAGLMCCVGDPYAMEIGAADMARGVRTAGWCLSEWSRIHDMQSEASEALADREMVEFIIQKHGGSIAPHKLASAKRNIADASEAEAILLRLQAGGWGQCQILPPGEKGGRPTRVFVCNPTVMS